MKKLIALFLVFSLFVLSELLQAQICFRGKPAPECKLFFLTEAGGFKNVAGDNGYGVNYEYGLMYNFSKRSALGAAFYTALDEELHAGFKLRYRYWLSSSFSLDISPGLLFWDGKHDAKTPEFTGHVGLNYKDWIALIGQIEILRREFTKNNTKFSFGIKFGSHAGITATGGSLVVLGVLIVLAGGTN